MKNSIIRTIATAGIIGLATLGSPVVSAVNPADAARDGVNSTGQNSGNSLTLREGIEIVTNVLLFVIGAVAVIMLIIGGFRYVTSNGDSSQITSAKNTILYAVVGIIVALLAYAIVDFTLDAFVAPPEG